MPRLDDEEAMTDDDNDELDDLLKTSDVNLGDVSSSFTGSSSLPQFDGMDIRKLVEVLAKNPLSK